jgi:WG containing repeat
MMRKSNTLIFSVLLTTTSLIAQPKSSTPQTSTPIASTNNAVLTTSDNKESDAPNLQYLNVTQARQYVRSAFNLLRDYTVSIESDLITQSFDANAQAKVTETKPAEATNEVSFGTLSQLPDERFQDYLVGVEKVLERKIKNAEAASYATLAEKTERQALLTRLRSILRSASCLVGKSYGSFVKTVDLEGNDIIAFRLDSLRSNARYSLVENYREGLSRIRKDQVYGFVNYCGEEVIPAQYEFADVFNSGKAVVKKVNWYFIDSKGEESDALENISDAKAITSGVSLVKLTNGKFSFINNDYDKTRQITASQYDAITPFYAKKLFVASSNKKVGLIDLDGTVKLPIEYDAIEPTTNYNLFLLYANGRVGLMDSVGNIKYSPTYTTISAFDKAGVATATDEKGMHLINPKTNVVTQGYASVSPINTKGIAIVRDYETKLYGLLNAQLEPVTKPIYSSLSEFNQFGLAMACMSPKNCGYINSTGTAVIELNYDELTPFNVHGLSIAKGTDKNCGSGRCEYEVVLNSEGKVVVPKVEKNADKIHYTIDGEIFSDNYISVRISEGKEAGFKLINKRTLQIVNNIPYRQIFPMDIYGLMRVTDDSGLQGLIDTTGKVVLKCSYDDIKRPTENYYPAKDGNGKWGFIDKKGKPQIPFEYEEVRSFRLGYTIVQKDKDKFGVINRFNAKVVPCAFKTATFTDKQKYVLTDELGNEIILNDKLDCEKGCARLDEIRRNESAK